MTTELNQQELRFKKIVSDSIEESKVIAELKLICLKNSEAIQKNSEAIQKNSEAIQKNSEAIQKNSEDIQKNSEDIQKNSEDIQKNSEAIQKNSEDIQKNSEAIQKNSEDIQKNSETIQKNSEGIKRNSQEIHDQALKLEAYRIDAMKGNELIPDLIERLDRLDNLRGRVGECEKDGRMFGRALKKHVTNKSIHLVAPEK